ncbi:MAG: prepilin-type N-terminal cleavage/methylation domain-containing protein [Candidatus Dojkabacteria bacterium]|jgi:prepilin-type N-terminal cleavage/methylation domain-containing protein|nr:prepilin-type N-terminal cleavage/methylation domain-containing protein [Candidatus Dojkabacteria bacterium]
MRSIKRKYKGFSLIELLLTMMILTVIMLLVATTLNTVIKVSNATNSKNTARSNMLYIMDFLSRALTNAELADVYMYNSSTIRSLGEGPAGELSILTPAGVGSVYEDGKLEDTDFVGNEIHIKLYGYSDWTCIGYFEDRGGYGYLVRTVYEGDMGNDHSQCFSESAVITPMHSFMIDVENFNLEYIAVGDGENRLFLINATLNPLYWPVRDTFPVTRTISRQSVVSTKALTWY